jgi:hypothetical protein
MMRVRLCDALARVCERRARVLLQLPKHFPSRAAGVAPDRALPGGTNL